MSSRPYDHRGKFVPLDCPECGCGTLRLEREPHLSIWRCDGLADPDDPNLPLEACTFTHIDGEPYPALAALDAPPKNSG